MEYGTYTRPELLKLCKDRGLSGAGTNEDLIDRLQAQDVELAAQGGTDDDPLADDEAGDAPPALQATAAPEATPDPPVPAPVPQPVVVAPAPGVQSPPVPAAARPTGPDPAVKSGLTGSVFRKEFPANRPVDDVQHRHLIAETHAAANAAGHRTRGGLTVGRRVGPSVDSEGRPTVVYEVHVKVDSDGRHRR